MSMNFLDAAGVLADSAELPLRDLLAYEAKSIVQAMVAAYDALAPDWSQAPEDAQWYTIDADGTANLHVAEPIPVALWYVSQYQRPLAARIFLQVRNRAMAANWPPRSVGAHLHLWKTVDQEHVTRRNDARQDSRGESDEH